MKNGSLFFFGLVAAFGLSWAGIVIGSNAQLGRLAPFYDDSESASFPARLPGLRRILRPTPERRSRVLRPKLTMTRSHSR